MRLQSPSAKKSLTNLLGYAEEILKAGEPVVSDLAKHAIAAFHEVDVATLEGVSIPTDDPGCWLEVARLREVAPPMPVEAYEGWMAMPPPGAAPFVTPRLVPSKLVAVTIEEASDLIEAALARPEDVMRPKGERAKLEDAADVLLRLEDLKEFATEFDRWVAGPWSEWEAAERPRRRSIAFYNRLFEIQQRASSMGDDAPIEMVFGVGMARWEHAGGRVSAPLVEASVELDIDPDHGAIAVRPRPTEPRLALRPFDELEIPGVGRLREQGLAQLLRFYEDPDVGFSPHERASFEQVLRMCHARLAPDAVYEPDVREPGERALPSFDDKLRITDTWVLYVRQRSSNFRCDDIRRLAAAIEAAEDGTLPAPGIQLTMQPKDARIDADLIDLNAPPLAFPGGPASGASTPATGVSPGASAPSEESDDRQFFFPLPYNDEQLEIARRLEMPDTSGVVVQGPPGTGKTHTIANIVAHYMATGRRVLVSAHQPEALAAIQSKLPESIRDLAISVIHSDREGARRLEAAVEILASQVKLVDKRAYNERRIALEAELVGIKAELAEVDVRLRTYARANLDAVAFRGEKLIPMELSARVELERAEHAWFRDVLGMEPKFDPSFGDADIAEAGRLRASLGADIAYFARELPDPEFLPDAGRLLAAHAALAEEARAEALLAAGELPYVSFGPGAGIDEARAARAWLDELAAWAGDIADGHGWLADFYRLLVAPTAEKAPLQAALAALCAEWASLAEQGTAVALLGVDIGDAPHGDEAFDAAVEALCAGRKPFGMFGKSRVKAQIAAVRVAGAAPDGRPAWEGVRQARVWSRKAGALAGRWSPAAAAAGFPPDAASNSPPRLGDLVRRMHRLHAVADEHARALRLLFPHGVDVQRVVAHLELSPAREALASSVEKESHAESRELRRRLADLGASSPRPFHTAMAELASHLGDQSLPARSLAEAMGSLRDEASRLNALRPARERLDTIAQSVSRSGASAWASALVSEAHSSPDHWTPEGWRRSWDWARAEGHVRGLSDREALARLNGRRAELEERRRELMGELVRVRTYIGLKQGITERVASALQKFAMKVRQLGAGTGKSAERHRRGIREAALEAASAVPCWILPEWRVAEQLPSELGTFDLVIVDEASQSDITSLPAVLRGKKVLVVGDDKQVSPSAVGMEERTVIQLRETFLRGMGVANFLEPTTSLYDLASMTFPGSIVMLREHFRCVEPIIAFSGRFYPKALIPLRVPTADERLDPPLVDVYVPQGRKVRDVNPAEAEFIVDEIASLVASPEYARRSIGVVSLIGDKQAKLIQDRLIERLGTEAFVRHRIMCGNASTFQGQERDVMFLSMVACPATARAQTARLMEQRFNVALSRARDRMYLVRSVAASHLSPADLKLAVIEHFRAPLARKEEDRSALEETESGFERDVAGVLLARGYRIRPQVPVGAFRIDIVVEGEGSRRLAVELDGDRYHGPERWFEDVHRQRALERLGWTFWRCWGSHWLADRQDCIDDLLATLGRLGIEPMGGELSPAGWTEHRIVGDEPFLAEQESSPDDRPELPASKPSFATVAAVPLRVGTLAREALPEAGTVVEVGDTVIVRFADDNHVRRFRLTSGLNDPDRGEVAANQPIARALMGNALEEEIDLVVGGRERRVVIEKITKAS